MDLLYQLVGVAGVEWLEEGGAGLVEIMQVRGGGAGWRSSRSGRGWIE